MKQATLANDDSNEAPLNHSSLISTCCFFQDVTSKFQNIQIFFGYIDRPSRQQNIGQAFCEDAEIHCEVLCFDCPLGQWSSKLFSVFHTEITMLEMILCGLPKQEIYKCVTGGESKSLFFLCARQLMKSEREMVLLSVDRVRKNTQFKFLKNDSSSLNCQNTFHFG